MKKEDKVFITAILAAFGLTILAGLAFVTVCIFIVNLLKDVL
jgi:hypothetical protein